MTIDEIIEKAMIETHTPLGVDKNGVAQVRYINPIIAQAKSAILEEVMKEIKELDEEALYKCKPTNMQIYISALLDVQEAIRKLFEEER